MVKRTFRKAQKEDLIPYFIKEEDIGMNDTVRSRLTARFGKVIGISKDGDTITVRWEAGGTQKLSKESVYKMREVEAGDLKDMTKVKSVYDDLKILERFGFIEFHSAKVGKRESLTPVLTISNMQIIINI